MEVCSATHLFHYFFSDDTSARADMETIKQSHQEHGQRLKALESEAVSSHTKLDDIADDVRIIKAHLMGAH